MNSHSQVFGSRYRISVNTPPDPNREFDVQFAFQLAQGAAQRQGANSQNWANVLNAFSPGLKNPAPPPPVTCTSVAIGRFVNTTCN
jgi:hypothetical protein